MIAGIPTNGGLIRTVLIILVVLLVLAYFGFNLRSTVNSPTFQDNWSFIRDGVVSLWNNYLKGPATYLWSKVFLPLIWEPAVHNLQLMKDGQKNEIQSSAPVMQPPQPIP